MAGNKDVLKKMVAWWIALEPIRQRQCGSRLDTH